MESFAVTPGSGQAATSQTQTWRPPGWSKPKLTSVTVTTPATVTNTSSSISDPTTGTPISGGSAATGGTTKPNTQASSTTYFFDSEPAVDHYTRLQITDHPVQSGASITDHAYAVPARVVLEVGMSDAMSSYTQGQYASNASKSVSAYQTFVTLQQGRQPLTLTTHLQTYQNMLIEEIRAADTKETVAGLKMTIVFRQIIIAQVSTQQAQSARPNSSNSTSPGTEQPGTVSPSTVGQHTTPSNSTPAPTNPNWSSDPFAGLN